MNFKQTVTNLRKFYNSTFLNLTIQTTANAYPILLNKGTQTHAKLMDVSYVLTAI
jgi:hypothetical protein